VIHYGNNNYRNNNKLIFDGEKFVKLCIKYDSYGSVPPEFTVGDNEGEFNIGSFEKCIDHNTINWLSKDKLKEVDFYIKDDNVMGFVEIRGFKWDIVFSIFEDETFNSINRSSHTNKKYKCNIENGNIIINIEKKYINMDMDDNKIKYIIKVHNNIKILKNMIIENPYVNIIERNDKLYIYRIDNKFKLLNEKKYIINEDKIKFPIIYEIILKNYTSQYIIYNNNMYDIFIKENKYDIDKIYIIETTLFHITIEKIKKNVNDIMISIKNYFISLVENYDDMKQPIERIDNKTLHMYFNFN